MLPWNHTHRIDDFKIEKHSGKVPAFAKKARYEMEIIGRSRSLNFVVFKATHSFNILAL